MDANAISFLKIGHAAVWCIPPKKRQEATMSYNGKSIFFLQNSRSTTHAREYNGIATSEILCNIIYLRPAYTE